MLVAINPAGPAHTVFTVTGTSTTGLNSTVQVRVTLDPIGIMGVSELVFKVTDFGGETACVK